MSSYDKEFTRARLQAADNLRRNGHLTAAARLVGLEILACLNKTSGCAFPAEETIARRLGITVRTVRSAVAQLRKAGCISITRRGRCNVYFPAFLNATIPEKFSGIAKPALPALPPTAEKSDTDTGKKQQPIPEKNNPLTLKDNPVITLTRKAVGSLASATALRSPAQARQKAENEIAKVIGWACLTTASSAEVEELCKRWPNVGSTELLEFKQKYETPP